MRAGSCFIAHTREALLARAFVVGNGSIVATGDPHGSLREIYAPSLAPEHQILRRPARIGLVMESVPAGELEAAVGELARRVALVDAELLSAHKRVVNLSLELAGARTMQRLSAEMDARAHLSRGPRRSQFRADMAEHGLKTALKNRDEPFGDGQVKLTPR